MTNARQNGVSTGKKVGDASFYTTKEEMEVGVLVEFWWSFFFEKLFTFFLDMLGSLAISGPPVFAWLQMVFDSIPSYNKKSIKGLRH